ncbi:MAG: hypothetical protein NTW28_19760 [Candidatus Solibacter sp.]|nr:hypothetical protein [Candidatus Solibacter sp.]
MVRAGYGITYDPVNLARNSYLNCAEITSYSASGVNSFQPVTTLTQGIPDIPAPAYGNGIVQLPKNVAVKLVDPEFKRSYIQSWSLVVQKQLTRDWTAEAGYVATRTIHEQFQWIANYAPIGTGNAGLALNQRFGRTASTILLTDIGHAAYDGLQTFLERRFARGYQVRFTYTWSKAIGTCCGTIGLDTIPINLPEAFGLMRAPLGFDRTHKLTASGTWELPFGKGQKLATGGVAAKLLGGWKFGGIVAAYTGTPFTASASGTSLNTPGVRQQADQVKSDVARLGQVYGWFDPLAFAPLTETRLGTSGFNIPRGPGVINMDSSVVRTFRINERVGLNFRAEALNTNNTPHFANPGANVSNMQVLSNGAVQLNGYTQITGAASRGTDGMDKRFFRLSLKVTF